MNTDQRIELVSKIAGAIAAQQDHFGPGAASQVSVWVSMAEAIVSDAEARAVERTARLLKSQKPLSPAPKIVAPPQRDEPEPNPTQAKEEPLGMPPENPAEPSDEELLEKATDTAA